MQSRPDALQEQATPVLRGGERGQCPVSAPGIPSPGDARGRRMGARI